MWVRSPSPPRWTWLLIKGGQYQIYQTGRYLCKLCSRSRMDVSFEGGSTSADIIKFNCNAVWGRNIQWQINDRSDKPGCMLMMMLVWSRWTLLFCTPTEWATALHGRREEENTVSNIFSEAWGTVNTAWHTFDGVGNQESELNANAIIVRWRVWSEGGWNCGMVIFKLAMKKQLYSISKYISCPEISYRSYLGPKLKWQTDV